MTKIVTNSAKWAGSRYTVVFCFSEESFCFSRVWRVIAVKHTFTYLYIMQQMLIIFRLRSFRPISRRRIHWNFDETSVDKISKYFNIIRVCRYKHWNVYPGFSKWYTKPKAGSAQKFVTPLRIIATESGSDFFATHCTYLLRRQYWALLLTLKTKHSWNKKWNLSPDPLILRSKVLPCRGPYIAFVNGTTWPHLQR